MRTITLTKPITSHKGETAELSFKEPTARSFLKHGSPYKSEVNRETNSIAFVWNNRAALAFIADMTDVDETSLEDMTANDFERCKTVVYDAINGTLGDGDSPL